MTGFMDVFNSADPGWKDRFCKSTVVPMAYNPKKVLIGKSVSGEQIYLSAKDAFRACTIAMTGTGKTFKIRRVLDQLVRAKWKLAIMPDAKNEYISSLKKIQEKYRKNLPEGDIPKGLKMRVFRPLFFQKVDRGKLPKHNEPVSLELADLTPTEFHLLCGVSTLSEKQQADFKVIELAMSEGEITNIEGIKQKCRENNFTKLWHYLAFLETCGLFDSRFRIDPVEVLNEGNVLILNYEKFNQLGIQNNSMDQIFMAVWLRWITDAKKAGELNDLMIINDETARWVPNNGEPACKKIILDSVDVDRMGGISWWFGIQRLSSVPHDLIDACRYKFVPYNIEKSMLVTILSNLGVIMNMVTTKDTKKFREIYDTLHAKKYRWLLIDKAGVGDKTISFVDTYSPTSAHTETKSAF